MGITTLLSLAWRFRKPLAIALAVIALVAAIGAAVLWHKGVVKRFGNERYHAGELAERGLWQEEVNRLKAANEVRRQSDEQSIRAISTELADEKALRRDQADTVDLKISEIENDDAKAGTSNPFDPRVLHLVR